MNNSELQAIWDKKYKVVATQLEKLKKVSSVATAFNTNIDAILKISGSKLKALLDENDISLSDIENITQTSFNKPTDVLIGIVKCFSRGIAEEWVTESTDVYDWTEKNLGYERLQMGGQAGIIANTLALLGIQKVIVHTNSHPELQAEQFLDLSNLLAMDDKGNLCKASDVSRVDDIPLIHWIIEFDKDDSFTYKGKTFTCPKSNRFIATYDPLNMKLVMNPCFVDYMNKNSVSYLVLSGFHPLLKENNGLGLIDNAVDILTKWKKNNPDMIIHLEIASTQDLDVRKAVIEKIAPLVHSAGLNERETIDLLQVMGENSLIQEIEQKTSSDNLFKAILLLKQKLRIPRIQLHMFGLYLTIQDEKFPYSAEQNLKGMMTAAVVSSSKALGGALANYSDVSLTLGHSVSKIGLQELQNLSKSLNKPELAETGLCIFDKYKITAVPTILIDKPRTLVGMGDTISSVSLLAGR